MKNWPMLLGVAAFAALMLASAGAAIVPRSMELTGPILCPAGDLNVDLHRFSDPLHGSGYTIDVSCTERGQRRDVSEFLVFLVLCAIYLIPCFVVVLGLSLWAGRRARRAAFSAAVPISDDLAEEVRALLAQGGAIAAVRRVRERTGVGLKEARDTVMALASGAPAQPVPSQPDEFSEPAPSDDSFETLQQLKSMLDAGLITAWEYDEKKREILSRM